MTHAPETRASLMCFYSFELSTDFSFCKKWTQNKEVISTYLQLSFVWSYDVSYKPKITVLCSFFLLWGSVLLLSCHGRKSLLFIRAMFSNRRGVTWIFISYKFCTVYLQRNMQKNKKLAFRSVPFALESLNAISFKAQNSCSYYLHVHFFSHSKHTPSSLPLPRPSGRKS